MKRITRRRGWLAAATLIVLGQALGAQAEEAAGSADRGGWLRSRIQARMEAHASGARTARAPDVADVAYGPDPLQKMDIYLPTVKAAAPAPVLIMVHGGGWRRGDKKLGAALQNKLPYYTGKGFVLISLNYRLVPQVTPVDQAYDVGRALAYVQANAARWGGDAGKVVLMGHSAGAHLVTLVTADARQRFAAQAQPWLGTISLDGAGVDVEQSMTEERHGRLLGNIYETAFGRDPALWKAASPMAQLHAGAHPLLMVCSTSRPDQPCRQTEAFVGKARQLGVQASTLPVALGHGEINADVGLENDLTRAIDQFLKRLGLPQVP